ncbi:MAG: peptidyl-prolyl cis-trans isomerase [Micavibrio sp.]|nr:peptidyl-prolyl cis-trans isomerase [Micavibrio sp.]
MLSLMRSGTHSVVLKFFLFGLLLMATVGLAVMDYQGMFRNGSHSNKVAESKCATITTIEFDHLLQSAMRRENMKQEDAYRSGYPQMFLQQEMNSRLLTCAVRDLGLYVDDFTAAKQLKTMLASFTKQGGITEKEALQRLLYGLGLNESKLVDSLKAQIGIENLMRALSAGAEAPQQMIDDAMKYRFEERRGEYFTISADDAKATPTDEDLKKYYSTISKNYMMPERRTLAVLVLDRKTLGGTDKTATPEALKDFYTAHLADYSVPAKRNISQVVAQDEATAKTVYDAALKSKDLKSAANAAGKAKATFIKPADYGENDLTVEAAEPAFKANEGDVLPPVKTPLGFLVLKVEKVKAGGPRSFDDAKADVEKDFAATSNDDSDALYSKANEIDDMVAGGKSVGDVAQSLGVGEKLLEKVDAKGLNASGAKVDAGVPAIDKVVSSGFSLAKGAVSQLIEAPTGEFLLVEARDVFPAEEQPLDKVKADITKAWQTEKAAAALDIKAAKILERLKMGESFDTVASSLGKHVERSDLTARREKPDSKFPHGFVPALFTLDKIGQVTVVPSESSAIILRLADRSINIPQQQTKEDIESMRTMLDHSVQKDILEQYRLNLVRKYKVKFDNAAVHDMYAAKANSDDDAE